jgi:hypothetical protein
VRQLSLCEIREIFSRVGQVDSNTTWRVHPQQGGNLRPAPTQIGQKDSGKGSIYLSKTERQVRRSEFGPFCSREIYGREKNEKTE